MGESEFLAQAEAALDAIEAALDRLNDEDVLDVECSRSGNVLEIEFIDNGSKIIVNSQAAMKELWVASRSGGYHYKQIDGQWINSVITPNCTPPCPRWSRRRAGAQVS
jgi:CyaY protein